MIEPCPDEVRTRVIEYLESRFGLDPELLAGYKFYASAKGRVIIGPAHVPENLNPDTAGILIARVYANVKPTSNLLQLFGKHMTQAIVKFEREEAHRYMQGLDMSLPEYAQVDFDDGYVLVQYAGYPLGCALLKEGKIKNMLPRAKRLELEFF